MLRGCLTSFFWSLNFHNSSLITHHSSLITQFFTPIWHHHLISITQYFSHYLWAHTCQPVQLFLIEDRTNEKKKKKKPRTEDRTSEKKESKGGQKLRLWVPPCVFIYKNAIELWVMEIENSQNVFSVSITHNSKIRELSDGNRVMKTELSFAKQPFCYGSHHFWVMSYGNWELSYQNLQSK